MANNAFLDMHIYVIYAGGLTRSLGMVTGLSTRTLEIPQQVVQTLDRIRLMADPIGSTERHVSDSLLVYPGYRIRYTIQNLLSLSVAWIDNYPDDEESEDEDEEDSDPEDEEEEAEEPEEQQTPDDSPNN